MQLASLTNQLLQTGSVEGLSTHPHRRTPVQLRTRAKHHLSARLLRLNLALNRTTLHLGLLYRARTTGATFKRERSLLMGASSDWQRAWDSDSSLGTRPTLIWSRFPLKLLPSSLSRWRRRSNHSTQATGKCKEATIQDSSMTANISRLLD